MGGALVTRLFLLAGAIALFACQGGKESSSTRTDEDPAAAAILVDAPFEEEGGVVRAQIEAGFPNTLVVKASASSGIAGTVLKIPPRSFELNTEVQLAEGSTFVGRSLLESLGFPPSTMILAVGRPVIMTWTYDEDSAQEFELSIPAPASVTLEDASPSLVVFYRTNRADDDRTSLGAIPPASLTLEGDVVTFKGRSYGLFQAAYLDKKVEKPVAVDSTEKISTEVTPVAKAPPGEFAILAPVQDLTTTPYLPANALVVWEPADRATSYDVSFDADGDCAQPTKTVSVQALSVTLDKAGTGEHHVCVTAKNGDGSTVSSNDGQVKIVVDAEPPPKVGSITGTLVDQVVVRFTWSQTPDAGPSGRAYYELQAGTTPGGADRFNGIVEDETKEVTTESGGVTIYARVRAVDHAGNAGLWSEVSQGVTVP